MKNESEKVLIDRIENLELQFKLLNDQVIGLFNEILTIISERIVEPYKMIDEDFNKLYERVNCLTIAIQTILIQDFS